MNRDAERWKRKLGLKKHPEGGYFAESYNSEVALQIAGFDRPKHILSAIYYMLVGNQFAAFHRIKSDEIWHHYSGCSLILYSIREGTLSRIKLGKNNFEQPQAVLHNGSWIAASLRVPKSFCLVGCTVSPGFDYRDWELARRGELVKLYPQCKKIIESHTIV
ncbi:MAG: cupin domain-containing protein [Nitrososphaera sp.]